jgi:hypothetical protein
MKRLSILTLLVFTLCSSNVLAQTITERADELLDQVNSQGILQVAQSEDLDRLDIQLLSLMLNLDLDDKEQAREVLEQRAEFELPETAFTLAGNRALHDHATRQTAAAMQQFHDAEIYRNKMRRGITPRPLVRIPNLNMGSYRVPSSLYGLVYSLWVANATVLLLDEVVAFYQQYGSQYILRAQHIGLQPQHTAVLQLDNCFLMRHYSLGIFFGSQLMARIPQEGQNMTPAMASEWHPWDRDPCLDCWEFGTSN